MKKKVTKKNAKDGKKVFDELFYSRYKAPKKIGSQYKNINNSKFIRKQNSI